MGLHVSYMYFGDFRHFESKKYGVLAFQNRIERVPNIYRYFQPPLYYNQVIVIPEGRLKIK